MISYDDIKSGRAVMPVGDGGAIPLVRYDAACRALAEAKSVDDVKDIRDRSEAMRAYAKQAKNKQLEVDAGEIRIRAERRLGEMIAAQRETVGLSEGGRPSKTGSQQNPVSLPTLAEAGIDKNLADRARKLAAIPEAEFTEIVSDWRDRVERENERVSVNLLKSGERHVAKQKPAEAYVEDEEQQYNDLQNAWNCAVRPARMRFMVANDLMEQPKAGTERGVSPSVTAGETATNSHSQPVATDQLADAKPADTAAAVTSPVPLPPAAANPFNNPRCQKPETCHLAHSRNECFDCNLAWAKRPRDEQVRLWAEAIQAARAA